MGFIARILLLMGGLIAGLFVSKDAHNFPVLSMVFGILLLTVFVIVVAYWSTITSWFKRGKNENE